MNRSIQISSLGFALMIGLGALGCSSAIVPGPPPPGPTPTLLITHWADATLDDVVVTGETFTLHGDAPNDFTLATTFTIDGTPFQPKAISPHILTFEMPPLQKLGDLDVTVSNGSLSSTVSITHVKLVITVAKNENRARVATLDETGQLTDRNLRLETGALPQDVVISSNGKWAFISSGATGVLSVHNLGALFLENLTPTFIPAPIKLNTLRPQRGLALSKDMTKLLIATEYYDPFCPCTLKEVAVVSIGTTAQALELTHLDMETDLEDIQNILLPGVTPSLRSLALNELGTLGFLSDPSIGYFHRLDLTAVDDGFANELALSELLEQASGDVLLTKDDAIAIYTGRGHTTFSVVDTETNDETVINLPIGDLTSEGASMNSLQSRLLVPTLNRGIAIFDSTDVDPGLWTPLAESILPSTTGTSVSSIAVSSKDEFAIWLIDELIQVIDMSLVDDGLLDNESVDALSYAGRGAVEFSLQP